MKISFLASLEVFCYFLGCLHLIIFFEVVFHFFGGNLSSWVKIRLHTENQLPSLTGSYFFLGRLHFFLEVVFQFFFRSSF